MTVKYIPLRKCIACASRKPKSEFIRIVKPPKNQKNQAFTLERGAAHKDGRGAYICKSADCIQKAIKSQRLNKTFRGKVENDVYLLLEKAVTECE